jgi:hypothetical protein
MARRTATALTPTAGPTLPPTFCRQVNGLVRINLSGEAINLDGFGYPQTGVALHYPGAGPDPVPFDPQPSNELGNNEGFDVDPGNGNWTCELLDSCSTTGPTTRTVVIWYQYEAGGNVHMLMDVFEIEIPRCGSISNC